jgi:hypothetical protein
MSKKFILFVIFLFVCWSLYTLQTTEGFQAAPPPELDKCEVFIGTYKTLQEQYKTAVEVNNQYLISSLPPGIDSIKELLKNMGCNIAF